MSEELVIGRMIRYYLDINNMTMKQLGEKLERTESTVSKWISGDSTPQAKELSKMTEIFNTDIQTLMFGGKNTDLSIEILNELKKLDEVHQKKVYDYLKFQLSEQKKDS